MDIFKIPFDEVNKADEKSSSFRPKEHGKGAGGKPVKAIFLLVEKAAKRACYHSK